MNIQFGKTRIREMMVRARKVVVHEGCAVIYMRYAIDGEWDTRSTSTWVTGGDKTAALVEAEKRGIEVVYGEMCETSQREMPLER